MEATGRVGCRRDRAAMAGRGSHRAAARRRPSGGARSQPRPGLAREGRAVGRQPYPLAYAWVRGRGAALRPRASGSQTETLVKVCGVMTPEDARMACEKGADFVGMIMSEGYKRSVDAVQASAIVSAARESGAEPVGIFTRETAQEIVAACDDVGLATVQLHGDTPRKNLKDLPTSLAVFYVVHSEGGALTTPLPAELAQIDLSVPDPAYWKKPIDWVSAGRRSVDYILVDKKEAGGTGSLDWDSLVVPKGCSRKGWVMAGGLTPENVGEAVKRFRPSIVDVSGGVTDGSGTKKDPEKVGDFIANAKAAA